MILGRKLTHDFQIMGFAILQACVENCSIGLSEQECNPLRALDRRREESGAV